jgi:hypothetical protein
MLVAHGHQPMLLLHLWNESLGDAHAISHQNWDYINRGCVKYFMTISCILVTIREAHISFQTIVLYACNLAKSYDINNLRMSSFYTTF